MGLLDDLRTQAEGQRAEEQADAQRRAQQEAFYREHIQPRMVAAFQFFNELVEHLNYVKMETLAYYPILAEGRLHPFRQQDYTVVIDSSSALKQIDFTFQGILDAPVVFEMFNKDAILTHSDRLDRYYIKYDRKDKKNAELELESAKFIIEGELPLKVSIQADVEQGLVKIGARNFQQPGYQFYRLKPDQFDDAFLDQLGKYILRQEESLFGEEAMSDEARKKLRDRLIVEKRIREQELREAEARRKAEEEALKQNSPTEQIKKAVNTKVGHKKEKLKDMFNRLKEQAGFNKS